MIRSPSPRLAAVACVGAIVFFGSPARLRAKPVVPVVPVVAATIPIKPHALVTGESGWTVEYGCVGDGFVSFRVPAQEGRARVEVVSATGHVLEVVTSCQRWTELVLPDDFGPPREVRFTLR